MKENYMKIIEDYKNRIQYTENEKMFRMNRLDSDASEIALKFAIETRGYKEMLYKGFNYPSPIVIYIEEVIDFILNKYKVSLTITEAVLFISKGLGNTGLFKYINIDVEDGFVRAIMDFSKLKQMTEDFDEFDVRVVVDYKLNVREKPDLMSKLIRTLNNGDVVRVLGEYGEWYKISDGYISKRFTKLEKSL